MIAAGESAHSAATFGCWPNGRKTKAMNFNPNRIQIEQEMRGRAAQDVQQSGLHIADAFPDENAPGFSVFFSYTAGVWQTFEQPELIVFGLRPEAAHAILHVAADHIRHGQRYVDGDQADDITRDYLVHFRAAPTDHPRWPMSVTSAYYGHRNYPVLQLVMPDKDHHWPWEPECDPLVAYSQQLIVG
jgi:hypothetical protein